MALGGVFATDTDGNLGVDVATSAEQVSGLIFDISQQSDFWSTGAAANLADSLQDKVVEFNTLADATELGITAYTGDEDTDFLSGIPYYHIRHFFKINGGEGYLYVLFADCSENWDAVVKLQRFAHGQISQIGIWTEQQLWSSGDDTYTLNLVSDLQAEADEMADTYQSPAVILLNANTSKVGDDDVELSKIPSCITGNRSVCVLLGQSHEDEVREMQASLDSTTPVGNIGAALGLLSNTNVAWCLGYVNYNDISDYIPSIEFGFGDHELTTTTNDDGDSVSYITDGTEYESLTRAEVDALDDLGYVFLCNYVGLTGSVFFSGSQTCDDGDYRTVARNRVINKSRRLVRAALLPYVHASFKIDPSEGTLSDSAITILKNAVNDALETMEENDEITSIVSVDIDEAQNVLLTDEVIIDYKLCPLGEAKIITVTEGLSLEE